MKGARALAKASLVADMWAEELAMEPLTGLLALVVCRLLGTEFSANIKPFGPFRKVRIHMNAQTKTSQTAWLALRRTSVPHGSDGEGIAW